MVPKAQAFGQIAPVLAAPLASSDIGNTPSEWMGLR
jgi:hypothetical protein